MALYRILVVDDSAFMRKFISDIVNADASLSVVGTARNGREAVEAVKRFRPDAVTLDVEMPELNGLEALPVIMSEFPIPVVMLSGSTQEGAAAAIRALELGAFDVVAKPSRANSADLERMKTDLISRLRAAADRNRMRSEAAETLSVPPRPSPVPEWNSGKRETGARIRSEGAPKLPTPAAVRAGRPAFSRIVAIGASTGGPRALQQVLSQLDPDFPAPILIVQHMPPKFTKSLADRLNSLCAIRVTEAEDGAVPEPGVAYIAPGGRHLTLAKVSGAYRLRLTDEPPRSGHRPSVDELFASLAVFPELDRTVVILTGMGSDGAKGMKLLYDGGVRRTMIEHPSSCVVYGMPRAAADLGCVSRIVPLEEMAAQITREVTESEEV